MRDKTLTKHHRLPKSLNGKDKGNNISIVPNDLHVAYHKLFKNENAGGVARILNAVWIDPNVKLIVVRRKNVPKNAM